MNVHGSSEDVVRLSKLAWLLLVYRLDVDVSSDIILVGRRVLFAQLEHEERAADGWDFFLGWRGRLLVIGLEELGSSYRSKTYLLIEESTFVPKRIRKVTSAFLQLESVKFSIHVDCAFDTVPQSIRTSEVIVAVESIHVVELSEL